MRMPNSVGVSVKEKLSITCQKLFETAQGIKTTILVIDVRSKDDFLSSRMKIPSADVINVSEDLIEPTYVWNIII